MNTILEDNCVSVSFVKIGFQIMDPGVAGSCGVMGIHVLAVSQPLA